MKSQTASCLHGVGLVTGSSALFLAAMVGGGCTFGAEGNGIPMPGLGCDRDLRPTALAIDYTPYEDEPVGGLFETSEEEFLVAGQPFAINWHWMYDGNFATSEDPAPPEPQETYTTRIEIREGDDVVWETDLVLDTPEVDTEGWQSVIVDPGLPEGFYVVFVDLDTEHGVPDCDFLWTAANNDIEMSLAVWDENGPPQNPTPCQEAELRNCRD